MTDRRGKLSLDAKAVHPAWYLPTTLTPNSKTWAGPYWRDCWVVRAAGSNAALWQLLYLGAGNGNGTPQVSSHQTDLRIKCLAWATFRNRTWGCSSLWGQKGSVNSDDEESRFTARKLNPFVEMSNNTTKQCHIQLKSWKAETGKLGKWKLEIEKVLFMFEKGMIFSSLSGLLLPSPLKGSSTKKFSIA